MANGDATVARLWLWVQRARTADPWEAAFAEQLPRIYNFFRYRVGPGPVAEDLTAATFEKNSVRKNKVTKSTQKSLQHIKFTHPLKQSQMLLITALSRDILKYPVCVS